MKQIILLNTGVSASKQTLAQFIVLAGRAWITHKIFENTNEVIFPPYQKLPVWQYRSKWRGGTQEKEKIRIHYMNNEIFLIADKAYKAHRAYFYVKEIKEEGYGVRFVEVPQEEIKPQCNIEFSLDQDTFKQYADRTLAPTIYKIQGHFQMKEIMSERVLPDLLYEEDWIDFWYNDERIAVGFRPLADKVADEITEGLELL